jgi:hypothetical protein
MDKAEKLRVAADNFSILLEDYKWRDKDASKMLEWLTPLFDEIKAGRVTPPKRYEYRMALGKDSSFYDPYGPFSRAEADFACALEDWASQPWYKQ